MSKAEMPANTYPATLLDSPTRLGCDRQDRLLSNSGLLQQKRLSARFCKADLKLENIKSTRPPSTRSTQSDQFSDALIPLL